LNNVNDPMARIENQIRSTSGGQDPAALRDAAASSIRAALSEDPAEQAAATDKAAQALAKAQDIPVEQARSQLLSISNSTMTPWRRRSMPPMQQPRRYREGLFLARLR
jgi:hypothetical protein